METINGSHFLFIKNWNNKNFQFLHSETYPTFFTPRDKKPRHSYYEETSSEFDLLEIKITRKQKYEEKIEQVFYKIYFLLSSITYLIYDIYLSILHWFKDIYIYIYIEKIFFKKYPNNIFDWLQRENRNLQNILKKI